MRCQLPNERPRPSSRDGGYPWDGRAQRNAILTAILGTAIIASAFAYAGAFDLRRYADALPTMMQLAADAMPPDFTRWRESGRPLLETLSMSIAGTVLGAAAALPLGALAARNVIRNRGLAERSGYSSFCARFPVYLGRDLRRGGWVRPASRHPGARHALDRNARQILCRNHRACRSRSWRRAAKPWRLRLGVLRFSVLQQFLPRLVDIAVYRWEHNLRVHHPRRGGGRRLGP